MSDPAPTLRLDNVGYRYPGSTTDALCGVSFEVGPSEFVGIVGPNGGGKTTMMKVLLGLLEPSSGTVRVFGRRPDEVRTRVGYVPQQDAVDATVPATVLDIVLMGRLSRSSWGPVFPRQEVEAAWEGLRRTGTDDLAARPWATLSGGQRQRVLVARALCADPELLLLDEPTTGVDLHREKELLSLLHRLNEHLPILLVSHDLALVSSHTDTAIWVNRAVTTLPARELTVAAVERFFHGEHSCHPGEAP